MKFVPDYVISIQGFLVDITISLNYILNNYLIVMVIFIVIVIVIVVVIIDMVVVTEWRVQVGLAID